MPGKQARVLCPVCQEPIPPDETECENCGAFVIDEAVVRLSRAFGLDRDRALKLFEAGFRHPTQLRDRDPNHVLEKGEVGLLFICTNCGGFVAGGDSKCPRCAAEFEEEPESPAAAEEGDILDLVLCPVCGADNDPELRECEICGEVLRGGGEPASVAAPVAPLPLLVPKAPEPTTPPATIAPRAQEPVGPAPEPRRPDVIQKIPPPARPKQGPSPTTIKDAAKSTRPPTGPPSPVPSAKPVPGPTKPPSAPAARSQVPEARPIPPPPAPRTAPPAITPPATPGPTTRHGPPSDRKSGSAPSPKVPPVLPSRLPRMKVRPPSRATLAPETVAGLVLAAGAGLLLAGSLRQQLVILGVSSLLLVLNGSIAAGLIRGTIRRPPRLDATALAIGLALGIGALPLRDTNFAGIVLILAGAACYAWLTVRLLRTPHRILLAAAGAIPLLLQGFAAVLDPGHLTTPTWMIGIAVALPWPTALASMEVLRRRTATVVRHQMSRAERDAKRMDYERSLAEYDRAIARTTADIPGAEMPWYGKGATLILLGRYDEAIRAIDKALDINPRNEVAWVNKGNALTRMGQLIDALRCFNAAIKVNPVYEVAWNNKGNALARLGKLDEALRCYERALAIDPGYRGAWVNMGFVLTKLGRFDEAASCADHALRLDKRGRAEPA